MAGVIKHLTDYSNAVIDGRIIAGRKHAWACLRFLDDLKMRGKWEWDFDEDRAERYYRWMRLFKHRKGSLAGQYKEPCDYEMFVYGNIYGWINKESNRRFVRMYEQLARKQAKSQNKAIQALYEMSAFGEPNAEVYVAATQLSQTRHVWEEAEWLYKNSKYKNKFTCRHDKALLQPVIRHIKSGSIFARLSKEEKAKGDGTNPHFGIIDEYHLHDTDDYYTMLVSGMKTRRNPLLSIITTAGVDLDRPCYRNEYKYVSRILNPDDPTRNDRYFAMICEPDRNETTDIIITPDGRSIEPGGLIDEIGSDVAIMKANPVTGGDPTVRKNILAETEEAMSVPERRDVLMTKTYNVWVPATHTGYIDMARWAACKMPEDELQTIIAEKAQGVCYVGIDLSETIDLSSASFVFPWKDDEGASHYAVVSHSFIPEAKFHERMKTDKMPYNIWAKDGLITVTDGSVIDYTQLCRYILDTCETRGWTIEEACIDPHGAGSTSNYLQSEGVVVVAIRQGVITLSVPTKEFRGAVYAGRVHHAGDPLLAWAVSNAEPRRDHNDNIMLQKPKQRTKRIDPIAATIFAFVRASVAGGNDDGETGWGAMAI